MSAPRSERTFSSVSYDRCVPKAEVTNSSLCENTGSRLVLLNYAQLVDVGDVENHDKRCQKSTLIHPVSKWSIKTLYFRLLVSKSGFPHG